MTLVDSVSLGLTLCLFMYLLAALLRSDKE